MKREAVSEKLSQVAPLFLASMCPPHLHNGGFDQSVLCKLLDKTLTSSPAELLTQPYRAGARINLERFILYEDNDNWIFINRCVQGRVQAYFSKCASTKLKTKTTTRVWPSQMHDVQPLSPSSFNFKNANAIANHKKPRLL